MTRHMKVKNHKNPQAPEGQDSPPAAVAASEAKSWTGYFLAREWVAFGIFIAIGIILRWTMLDMRPYHHDESLHGMYGRYFYDFPNSNYYKYDPMLHGPMLYNCMRFIYAMFGDSLWAARTPVCIMGTLFMFVPFLYRAHLKRSTVLILTAAVALSPTLVYWSRFLREDFWVVSGMLLAFYGFTVSPRPLKAFFVLFGLTIQWCTKENVFVTLAIFAGYPVFEAFFDDVVTPRKDSLHSLFTRVARLAGAGVLALAAIKLLPEDMFSIKVASVVGLIFAWFIIECLYESAVRNNTENMFGKIGSYIQQNTWETILGFMVSAIVFCWFYAAGFRYPQGILDGLGGKAIDYWGAHHAMERIKGPFNFHLYVTAWYELPFFIALLAQVVLFYRRASGEIKFIAALGLAVMVLSCLVTNPDTILDNRWWKWAKLKDRLDIIGLFVLLFHAPLVTIQHMLRGERTLATAGYFFTATLFSYSYLGEKVPWLSMYPLVFGLPYLALFFQDYFTKYPMNYATFPVRKALLWVGSISMLLGLIFVFEQWNLPDDRFSLENRLFLIFGLLLVSTAVADSFGEFLGTIHLGRWLTILTCIFLVRAAVQTNYVYAGKETEYLSQVHTTYELAETAKQIVDEVKYERNGYKPRVYATGESTWPLTWYYRNIPDAYRFNAKPEEMSNFTYQYQKWSDGQKESDFPEGYYVRRINLRGWWVPEWKQVTLKKFLRYSINHYPWSPSGFSYATFLVAKDTAKFKEAQPMF